MVRLRGHHLVCLHFFLGEGYKPEFIENLKEVLGRVKVGEEIEILVGADDVCKECPHLKGKICLYDENAEDEIREMDRTAIELLGLRNKGQVKWTDIKKKIPGVFKNWARRYCEGCDWRWVCEKNKDFSVSFSAPARENSLKMRALEIDFDEVQKAMEDVVRDTFDYYFDLETGEVAAFSEEILEEARSRLYDSDSDEVDDDTEYVEFDEEPEFPGWMLDEIELAIEILLDEERFIRIPERSSAMAFESMAEFADSVEDPLLKEKLDSALDGKGAFRKFKDALIDYPKERKRWHGHNAKAMKNEITEWLASIGIEPAS